MGESRSMNQADLFRNLLLMAAIDGRMSEAELRLLSHRAAEWGITDEEFERAIQDAIDGNAELTIPTSPSEALGTAEGIDSRDGGRRTHGGRAKAAVRNRRQYSGRLDDGAEPTDRRRIGRRPLRMITPSSRAVRKRGQQSEVHRTRRAVPTSDF